MIKISSLCFILVSLLFQSVLVAAEEEKLNEDGSEYLAPRLAGDSLPIRTKEKKQSGREVNSLHDAITKGTVKGLLRFSGQYRDSNLHLLQDADGTNTSSQKKQQYSVIGGYLGYETAPWFNTSVGATFYTAHPFGNNPDNRLGLGGLNENGATANSYTVLGEAYLKFQNDAHRFVVGRQEMPDYRFVSLSDIRMSPFVHEGVTYENTLIEGLQVNVAYITKQKDRNSEDFEDLVRAARVKTGCGAVDSNGNCITTGSKKTIRGNFDPGNFDASGDYSGDNKELPMVGLVYKKSDLNLEAWDYYVNDFVNTFYVYADYSIKMSEELTFTTAGQYANQQDVGESVAGNVDTWFYGIKAQASFNSGMTLFMAYNEVEYNESSYDGGTIFVRWGTPQMFNSFQVQDSELAGTKSVGVGAQFELGKMGLMPNTVIRFRYADYNMPDELYQIDARQDRTEATFDLRYSFTKNDGFGIFTRLDGLSVQFRVAYNNYETGYDFDAYKAINGYDFLSVTDDFVDYRLYVEYLF